MPAPKAKKKPSRKPIDPAVQAQRRFTRSIRTMFTNLGFAHIRSEGKEAKFGLKKGELDSVFLYENVVLVVEDTTSAKAFDHAKNKALLAQQIFGSKNQFIEWLRTEFPDHKEGLDKYSNSRFKLFYLYISEKDMELDEDSLQLLEPMRVVTPRALTYFDKLGKTIRRSAKTDLWRFLNLQSGDIGPVDATKDAKTIETTIIAPDGSTGFTDVRVVSFMIAAEVLLRNCYVLRKDNWEFDIEQYQRLIDNNRIKKIRQYVASDKTFLNNIIVGLPSNVTFQAQSGDPILLKDIQDFQPYKMMIPNEFNSLCLIDGQHRVFAHYEGTDDLEPKVAVIRGKIHLLATGLIFPKTMDPLARMKLQSQIFLEINSNTKPVPADVLLAIQSLQEPYADVAIARRVLELLNRKPAFRGMLQLSQMDKAPIKIASIVKFALRYLVDIDADSGLFAEWVKGDKSRAALKQKDNSELLDQYVKYCATTLDLYFKAFKNGRETEWDDPKSGSKVTSTTVINAMIIALRRSLPALGVLTFEDYLKQMKPWNMDFSKAKFPYASSQYARFSVVILQDVFKLVERDGGWVKP